jgi:hypothetical protein
MPSPPTPPRPLCFVAMPFGKKAAPGGGTALDFDAVYQAMATAIERVGLECHRADFDPSGGFIHRAMFEALLVAELVVVDLTFANANVAYEVGLRHGANAGHGTILICEEESLKTLPFDFKPLRTMPYTVANLGKLGDDVATRLQQAMAGELPNDNPILQITSIHPCASGHEKTDLFAQRMAYLSEVGAEVKNILARPDKQQAIAELQALETQLLGAARAVEQLHTALLAIYLGYREKKAWPAMVALFGKMPRELQATPVAREQLALAHNRIAEGLQDAAAIQAERQHALHALEAIPPAQWTSETYGILGRVHKGRAEAERVAHHEAESRAALAAAIKAYESGFRADPRDYYPGVNAVTLRILRNKPEDQTALDLLLPAVRFSVERAPTPTQRDESYWQAATKLELAAAAGHWEAADRALDEVLAVQVPEWMHETTAENLAKQARARAGEAATKQALAGYVEALVPGRPQRPS